MCVCVCSYQAGDIEDAVLHRHLHVNDELLCLLKNKAEKHKQSRESRIVTERNCERAERLSSKHLMAAVCRVRCNCAQCSECAAERQKRRERKSKRERRGTATACRLRQTVTLSLPSFHCFQSSHPHVPQRKTTETPPKHGRNGGGGRRHRHRHCTAAPAAVSPVTGHRLANNRRHRLLQVSAHPMIPFTAAKPPHSTRKAAGKPPTDTSPSSTTQRVRRLVPFLGVWRPKIRRIGRTQPPHIRWHRKHAETRTVLEAIASVRKVREQAGGGSGPCQTRSQIHQDRPL